MTTPCPDRSHSPTLSGTKWSCEDCASGRKPSPLSRIHAALDRTRPDEWAVFVAALRQAVGPGGLISQTNVRPLIQAIPPKHRGLLYRRAVKAGLIKPLGYEPSTDAAGGNTDKPQRTYLMATKAA